MLPKQETPTESIDRARAYKSRNKRPCDFCRYKKAACHLETAPPCELCVRYGKECTFVESPAKRRRPNEQTRNAAIEDIKANLSLSRELCSTTGRDSSLYGHQSSHGRTASMALYPPRPVHHQDHLLSWEAGLPSFAMDPTLAFDPQLFAEPLPIDPFEPFPASATSTLKFESPDIFSHASHGSTDSLTSPPSECTGFLPALRFESTAFEPSPEQDRSFIQFVGSSGELDPCLLSKYEYSEDSETNHRDCKIRRMTSAIANGDAGRTTADRTFFVVRPSTDSPISAPHWRHDLEKLVPSAQGAQLVDLFYEYIHSSFPILPLSSVSTTASTQAAFPVYLLAAIYAHALQFVASDARVSLSFPHPASSKSGQMQDNLFAFSHAALQPAIQTPDVTVIQTLLLHLQRGHRSGTLDSASVRLHNRLTNETDAGKWAMMCQTLGLAQGLGLDRNCTSWTVVLSAERKLRKRLAWGVWVAEKWLAAGLGRRSLSGKIGEDGEVPYLTAEDFHEDGGRDGEEADAYDSLSPASPSSPKNVRTCKKRKWDGEETDVKEADPGHFTNLCTLTEIVEDILTELYSPTATNKLGGDLESTLEVAKPLRLRLAEWHRALPADLSATLSATSTAASSPRSSYTLSDTEGSKVLVATRGSSDHSASLVVVEASITPATPPDQPNHHQAAVHDAIPSTSLHLSYITAKILLFRALLRASSTTSVDNKSPCPALEALRLGSLATAHDIICFVSNLTPQAYASAFWPAYAAQQIGIASSFLLLLAHTTDNGHGAEAREMVMEWTDVLRARAPQFGVLRSGLDIVEDGWQRLPGKTGKSER